MNMTVRSESVLSSRLTTRNKWYFHEMKISLFPVHLLRTDHVGSPEGCAVRV
jgi:hypothetical protein